MRCITIFTAIDSNEAGFLAIADSTKSTSTEGNQSLHAFGLRLVVMTGDNQRTADFIARTLSLDEVIAGVSASPSRQACFTQVFGWLLRPIIAGAAMSLSPVSVS